MSSEFDINLAAINLAAAYKAVDERVELICAVATRLLNVLDEQIILDPRVARLMEELRRVMR